MAVKVVGTALVVVRLEALVSVVVPCALGAVVGGIGPLVLELVKPKVLQLAVLGGGCLHGALGVQIVIVSWST